MAVTAWPTATGMVIKSSIVPCLRSSAHMRIESAGMRNRYIHGCHVKKGIRSAWPRSSKPAWLKVRMPTSNRKMTMNT